MKKDMNEQEENFAEMFENSMTEMETYEPGQPVKTEIVSIAGDYVFLQLNGKSEGVLEKAELLDKEGKLTVREGDTITAYFLSSKNGEMLFTTRLNADKAGKEMLENAFNNGIPIEGVVEKEIKGGFEIKIGDTRAFCPFSQMDVKRIETPAEYIGRHLTFKITEFSEKGRNILVSNRAILEAEQQKQVEALKKTLSEGMTVKGTVKSIQDFGAFVDISGFQALLPVSEISRSRVEKVESVLAAGQEIEASIIKLDWKKEKITLSMKALERDPWDDAAEKYREGTKHKGEVVRVTDFGAFVSLEPGLDGLVHISDLKGDSRDANPDPRNFAKKGQSMTVVVNSVDTEKKRISLKPASAVADDKVAEKYMAPESETYNPFADFFKNKK